MKKIFLPIRIPHRLDIYELLNRTSSRIVRVAAASGLAQEFRIVLQPKVNIRNSTSSVYSSLYGIYLKIVHCVSRKTRMEKIRTIMIIVDLFPNFSAFIFHVTVWQVSSSLAQSFKRFLGLLGSLGLLLAIYKASELVFVNNRFWTASNAQRS